MARLLLLSLGTAREKEEEERRSKVVWGGSLRHTRRKSWYCRHHTKSPDLINSRLRYGRPFSTTIRMTLHSSTHVMFIASFVPANFRHFLVRIVLERWGEKTKKKDEKEEKESCDLVPRIFFLCDVVQLQAACSSHFGRPPLPEI